MQMLRRHVLAVCLCSLQVLSVTGDCSVEPSATSLNFCTAQPHGSVNTPAESWGIKIRVGDQELCVTPSTVTNYTFLPSYEACANDPNNSFAACISRRGGLFDLSESHSSFVETGSLDQLLRDNPNWIDIQVGRADATRVGNVTLNYPPQISLNNLTVGIIAGGQNHSNGHLGLAQKSVFLQSLVDRNLIPTPSFGLNAGSQYQNRSGYLVLGGYDRRAIEGPLVNFPISSERVADRWCPLQVRIKQLDIVYANSSNNLQLVGPGVPARACIEPYDNLFRFPNVTLHSFINSMTLGGWRDTVRLNYSEFLVIEPGLYFDLTTNLPFNGSFKFILDNGPDSSTLSIDIPTEELVRSVPGLLRNGTRQQNNNIAELAVFGQGALFDAFVLGKVFLSRAYLNVLYHEKKFQLAALSHEATTGTPSGPDIIAFTCTPSPHVRGMERKTIIGASVGGAIGGIVLAVSGYLLWITFKPRPAPLPTTIPLLPQAQLQPDTQQPTQ